MAQVELNNPFSCLDEADMNSNQQEEETIVLYDGVESDNINIDCEKKADCEKKNAGINDDCEKNKSKAKPGVLILDLDQTIWDCDENCQQSNVNPQHKCHLIKYSDDTLICHKFRPYLEQFFAWCESEEHQLVIWSAVTEESVRQRVKLLKDVFNIKVLGHLSGNDMSYGSKTLSVVYNKFNLQPDQVLAIDDCKINYWNERKCLYISPWYQNPADTALMEVTKTITTYFQSENKLL